MEEEAKLRKRVNKGAFGIAKDKASITASMEKVQSYEDAFAKIQQATKISDIDVLVQTFINAEEHNFQLFNQVCLRMISHLATHRRSYGSIVLVVFAAGQRS